MSVAAGDQLRRNIDAVEHRLAAACVAVGRPRESVRLLAVTKTRDADTVAGAVAAGLHDVAENNVHEAHAKWGQLRGLEPAPRWHLVGHLQRNKAKAAIAFADEFHALDSVELAVRLDRLLAAAGRRLDVFVQVNTSGEPSKHGVTPAQAEPLAAAIADLPRLEHRGWMTIAVHRRDDPAAVRRCFESLRNVAEQLSARGLGGDELSMGMSGDFELAIAEGATTVRVGQALFGAR